MADQWADGIDGALVVMVEEDAARVLIGVMVIEALVFLLVEQGALVVCNQFVVVVVAED